MNYHLSPYELPDGCRISEMPKLPVVRLEKEGFRCSVTDLLYLNVKAQNIVLKLLEMACNIPDCQNVLLEITDFDEFELEIINSIVMGIRYKCKKGNMKQDASLICASIKTEKTSDKVFCTFYLIKSHARIAYEYAQQNGKKKINYYELALAIAEKSVDVMANAMKSKIEYEEMEM